METQIAQEAAEVVEQTGGIAALGINLQLLLAQLVNFLVVLLIFWKWIYGPVKALLQKRQETIEKSLQDAKQLEERMTKLESEREMVLAQAKEEASVYLNSARENAKEQEKHVIEKTKEEVTKIIENGKKQLKQEKQLMLQEAKQDIVALTITVAQKLFAESIDKKDSQKQTEKMVEELYETKQ